MCFVELAGSVQCYKINVDLFELLYGVAVDSV